MQTEMKLSEDRLAWFRLARYGMFIHWGLYSLLGRGEWAMNREAIASQEYMKLADRFTAAKCDPKQWAQAARDAGMRYVVLTTKHHDGFCLWNSGVCSYNSVHSAARRDIVGEFVEAVRSAGLKVGLYYSLGDWHNPDWAAGWSGDAAARERFMAYTHALVRELMSQYGKIDVLWYDLPQCYSPAEWRAVDLNAMARRLQPHILINNRAMTTEDFGTPEQHVSAAGRGRMWEACMTLNESWGYCPSDHEYKTARQIALMLAQVASGAGNLLLNVGPDGEGRIPEESQGILHEVASWLGKNGEGIYNCNPHNLSWNLWGPLSVCGNNLYLYLGRYFGEKLIVGGLTRRVLRASLLSTGQMLQVEQRGRQVFLSGLPQQSPDPVLSVVKLELDGVPDHDLSQVIGGADVFPDLPK